MAHHQISLRASRRKFIAIIGGAAVSRPCAVQAQQTAKRVIGFLDFASSGTNDLEAFRAGLSETGFVEGRNDRWADGDLIGPEQIGLLFYPRMLYFAQRRSGLTLVLRAEE